jgi:hypothetical protein
MDPSSFSFKVSVPNDPRQATVIGELAKHAAAYAQLDAGAAAAFGERAQAMAARALTGASGNATTAIFAAADGKLTVTVGGESASQSL